MEKFSLDIVENIIDDALELKHELEPHELILDIIEKLVDSLSFDFLEQEESVHFIAQKLMENIVKDSVNRHEILKLLETEFEKRQDVTSFMHLILEKVYGEGIEYLYVVNDM